jgi:hypothetical protein
MKNPKMIIIAAAVGFFLSFMTALISGVGIGGALLKAAVSAVVCAAVATGLSLAARKFLLETNGQKSSVRETTEPGMSGNTINIVLEDEGLPSEPDDPLFSVGSVAASLGQSPADGAAKIPRQPLAADAQARLSEIGAASPRKARESEIPPPVNEPPGGIGFMPADISSIAASGTVAPFAEAEEVFSRKEPLTAETLAHTAEPAPHGENARNGSSSAGMVDLPDIGMLVTEGLSTGDDVLNDTEFASATKAEVAAGHITRAFDDVQTPDSQALAGAIRTLLASE